MSENDELRETTEEDEVETSGGTVGAVEDEFAGDPELLQVPFPLIRLPDFICVLSNDRYAEMLSSARYCSISSGFEVDVGQAFFSEVTAVLGWVDDGESSSKAFGVALSNPCAVLRVFKELLTLGDIRGDRVTVAGLLLVPITA